MQSIIIIIIILLFYYYYYYYYYYSHSQDIFCIISLCRVKVKDGLAELRKERTGGGTFLARALEMVCT